MRYRAHSLVLKTGIKPKTGGHTMTCILIGVLADGVVLIPSGLCFFACAAFTVFLSIVRDTINSTANNEVLHI